MLMLLRIPISFSDKFRRSCLFNDEADSGGTHEEGLRTILSKFMNMILNVVR